MTRGISNSFNNVRVAFWFALSRATRATVARLVIGQNATQTMYGRLIGCLF
jgi:hypothetical protein